MHRYQMYNDMVGEAADIVMARDYMGRAKRAKADAEGYAKELAKLAAAHHAETADEQLVDAVVGTLQDNRVLATLVHKPEKERQRRILKASDVVVKLKHVRAPDAMTVSWRLDTLPERLNATFAREMLLDPARRVRPGGITVSTRTIRAAARSPG
ncbi:MAG TPA: hypothetical protein VGP82_18420 [Ktedonobacterales bacterium]|jgi:hypothetical protein|nr:hypothetical protein [Ktedonobacterales bacterium]